MSFRQKIKRLNKSVDEIVEGETKSLRHFGFEKYGEFSKEDVFIIGYPKSGNTLLQHLVAHLVFGLRPDAPISLINSCVTEHYNNPYFFRHDKRHFFKSHELPSKDFKKVIYIVRDGRDAVRSYYYMQKNMGQTLSLEELYKNGGKTFVGTWANHIQAWTKNEFNADLLIVKYEELIANKKVVINAILQFLALERTEAEIENAAMSTSLENMKKMEKSFSWQRSKSLFDWQNNGDFVREGKSKGYESDSLIDESWLNEFTKSASDTLKKMGYDI